MKNTSLRISVDDGCASDVRVAELATKYGIECVFYWPIEHRSLAYENGYKPLSYTDQLNIAHKFEVGSHTCTHRHLTKIDVDEAYLREIMESKLLLKMMFHKEIKKFCPPRGYVNDELVRRILIHYDSYRLTKGPGLVHIHPNSGANNNKPWRECVDENTTELWMHSWELDRYPEEWDNLENFLKNTTK